jgi:hypothetical protein
MSSSDRTSVTPVAQTRAIADIAFGTQAGDAGASRTLSWLAPEELEIDLDDPVQRRFGDYELVERIGHGGMGVVYRARQLGLDRDVALKLLAAGPWASEEFVARFRREARHAARMKHPNIVEIYEFGERDGLNFFSMRLVEGPSLAQRVAREGAMPEREAAACVRLLAEAMDYAHRLDVLHLDLKPANVLTGLAGEPLIADFGLARRVDASGLGAGEEISGTPSYMAPEQALLRSHPLTASTDIYGLGAILYELLCGQPPFAAGDAQSTLERVVAEPPRPPRQLKPTVSRDIEAICLKCLEKEPAARYASARELADDLQRFVEGRPVSARPLGPRQRLARWTRREPKLALAVGSALLALAVGAGATALQWSRANQALADAEYLGLATMLPAARNSAIHKLRQQIRTRLDEPARRATMRRLAQSSEPRDWLTAGMVGDTLHDRADLEEGGAQLRNAIAALPSDRFALKVAIHYCGLSGGMHRGSNGVLEADEPVTMCSVPDAAQRLAAIDPDNLFAWTSQIDARTYELNDSGSALWKYRHDPAERARVRGLIARAARAKGWDDGTREILRARVAAYGVNYIPIPTMTYYNLHGETATADGLRGSLAAEYADAWLMPAPNVEKLLLACDPERSVVDPALRGDCLRILRILADSRSSLFVNMIGFHGLKQLGRGTPLEAEATAGTQQMSWQRANELSARDRDPVASAAVFTRDFLAHGEREALLRYADRLGTPRQPAP